LFTEEVQIGHGHTGAAFAGEGLGHPRFNLLPGHARGQHRQRVAQVDHVLDARAKEIVGGGAGKHHGRTPRNQPLLDIKLGVLTIGNHPRTPAFIRVVGVIQGRRIPHQTQPKNFRIHDRTKEGQQNLGVAPRMFACIIMIAARSSTVSCS
jgi:hypothetical protein